MEHDPEGPDEERGESEVEREDRKWEDMLQELRVMQTGAQLTAGFLLTLPFAQGSPTSPRSSATGTSHSSCSPRSWSPSC